MEPLHYLALTGQNFDYSRSALPEAPVVECTRPGRAHAADAVRGVIAHSLHRLGDAVAPSGVSRPGPVAA